MAWQARGPAHLKVLEAVFLGCQHARQAEGEGEDARTQALGFRHLEQQLHQAGAVLQQQPAGPWTQAQPGSVSPGAQRYESPDGPLPWHSRTPFSQASRFSGLVGGTSPQPSQ